MMVATLAASYALERIGFEALRQRGVSVMFVFVFTFIVSEFVAYLAMLVFGTWPQTIFPMIFWPVTLVGNIAVSALGSACDRRHGRGCWRHSSPSCASPAPASS